MSFKDFFSLFLVLVAIVFCGDGTILAMLVQGHGRNISVMLLLLLLFIYLFFFKSIDRFERSGHSKFYSSIFSSGVYLV